MRVTIVVIPPAKYPAFQRDADHPCIALEPAARIAEIDACCASLWARACSEQKAPVEAPELNLVAAPERRAAA